LLPLSQYHQVYCWRGDPFERCGILMDVVVHLHYPHHSYLPLVHCSPLGLGHVVHLPLHDYLDQYLVRVE
jgi:hypothetical protein